MGNRFMAKSSLRGAAHAIAVAACIAMGALFAIGAHAGAPSRMAARDRPVEVHQRLVASEGDKVVALTLDACGGGYDVQLIDTLIELRVPATVFVTRKWIDRHPEGIATLNAHPDLFAIEDHGASHVPAVIGAQRRVYGLRGEPDVASLQKEIEGGARAIVTTGAPSPNWYRGATALYDRTAMNAIEAMGYRIAGFSVNADAGATLSRREIVARLTRVKPGDIIIAHVNKPASESAEALQEALPVLLRRGMQFVTLRGREVQTLPGSASRS
jgi:peptidoglycan/xylan/chitin deacetylase (PgdA/CDA1 family)